MQSAFAGIFFNYVIILHFLQRIKQQPAQLHWTSQAFLELDIKFYYKKAGV